MSVLSLGLVLVAILAAVVLLFPVVFRVDFKLTESGFVADLFVFKKNSGITQNSGKRKKRRKRVPSL